MADFDAYVHVRGAKQNNLRNVDVDIPRDAFVVFTGVSGSGKSSLAFGTIYAEAQRRYFESVAPYARRLIEQLPAPKVGEIRGLPPAVALQQRRGEPTVRSSVGTVTTLSNSLRMLFSRAGTYPVGQERLDSDAFSANTHAGACAECHGMGVVHTVTEESLVPDPSLSIRDHAIAAWPGAWQGKNLRDILAVLGYDIDKPWKDLSEADRKWILFTDEKPVVTVYAERDASRIQRPYQGTYMSAANYVLHTFANTKSETLRKRAAQFMQSATCKVCQGKRLQARSLAVKFAGHDISSLAHMPLAELPPLLSAASELSAEQNEVATLLSQDLLNRISVLEKLGLDYLSIDRSTPSLSAGELQRLRLATQMRSGLFGVVYILDEPSAGLHPADTESLLQMLHDLRQAGNSLFVVEHEMSLVRKASWIIDVGPAAGDRGGEILYSGPVSGLQNVKDSQTCHYLYPDGQSRSSRAPRSTERWLRLSGISMNNLRNVNAQFPLGVMTAVTGVSGSGKTTLVCKVLADTIATKLGMSEEETSEESGADSDGDEAVVFEQRGLLAGAEGLELIDRLVIVDQKPIGRTPRSNLATYTGLFDTVRQRFAATDEAKKRGFNAGKFSFNVDGGRCPNCEGEGFVSVELLFLPRVYAPCTVCHGARYKSETLEILYEGKNIAQVLEMTVDAASDFFSKLPAVARTLKTLREVGLGYLRIGQPATELSGGEAQRIKLAAELQRAQRGHTLYVLDEPTTGLHPADVEKLISQLHGLVDAGNTVIVVEHDMDVISSADWIIDLGPGGGNRGGQIVATGTPLEVSKSVESRTAPYLAESLALKRPAKKTD